eukprot:10559813-Heterocapsa_arctica.AAC.1
MSEVESFALPSSVVSISSGTSLSSTTSVDQQIEWEEEDLLPTPRPRELREAAFFFQHRHFGHRRVAPEEFCSDVRWSFGGDGPADGHDRTAGKLP